MRVVQLSGGVGGARLARGFHALDYVDLTVIVNVGDDTEVHGLAVSPDIDTVLYTLAGVEGPFGWGRQDDTFRFNEEIRRFGVSNDFRLGDLDLAMKVYRTMCLAQGETLSQVAQKAASAFEVDSDLIPATDDRLRTQVRISTGWISFSEYFVERRHRDKVLDIRFEGADVAVAAPGVIEAITAADRVVIGPSNPPLSIWPITAIEEVRKAVASHPSVMAVSPLIGGKTIKGPAAEVMVAIGLAPGNAGVAKAYEGLIDDLVIHTEDAAEAGLIDVPTRAMNTLIPDLQTARDLASELLSS